MKKSTTVIRKKYPLDSSASIHLASLKKEYSNTFRFSATLSEAVNPDILQKAFDNIAGRFPTIVAGIKSGFFNYYITPVDKAPAIKQDEACLKTMTRKEIRECAIQVLYSEKEIAVETFHALTDGNGGTIFLSTLVAEYISLCHGVTVEYSDKIFDPKEPVKECELVDDYISYSGTSKNETDKQTVYQIPGDTEPESKNTIISKTYKIQDLLDTARSYGVSLTTFLTAVMADSILQLQKKRPSQKKNTVKILVSANLRKKFESSTLYNFSLYALPHIMPREKDYNFKEILQHFSTQLKKQLSAEYLQNTFTMNTKYMNWWLFKILPLPVKHAILKFVYHRYGERNSCISVSNLGEVSFPKEIKPYIDKISCILTPRRNAPYNCGLISYNGRLHINISRKGKGCGLEEIFYNKLEALMAV